MVRYSSQVSGIAAPPEKRPYGFIIPHAHFQTHCRRRGRFLNLYNAVALNVHFLNLPQYGDINKQMIPSYLPQYLGWKVFGASQSVEVCQLK